jgi:hypothetical protein
MIVVKCNSDKRFDWTSKPGGTGRKQHAEKEKIL